MVSDDGLSYAAGNLRAGPSQWKRMYTTGSTVALAVNLFLAYLHILPPLYSGTTSGISRALIIFTVEFLNAMIPILAWALDRPGKAILTVIVYILTGLAVWTTKYETAMAGR